MSAPKKFRGYAFTVEDWLTLCEMHGNRCAHCGEEKPLTVDHIKPRAAGGTDDIANIQPLCKACNSKKGSEHEGVRIGSFGYVRRVYELKTEKIVMRVRPSFKEDAETTASNLGVSVTEMFEDLFKEFKRRDALAKQDAAKEGE